MQHHNQYPYIPNLLMSSEALTNIEPALTNIEPAPTSPISASAHNLAYVIVITIQTSLKSNNLDKNKLELRPTKVFETKYNKVKAKLTLLSSGTSASKSLIVKNKGLVAEAYEWDEEEVSSDDNEMVEVKVLMALSEEENVVVGKESARNGEWVKISMTKVHTLLDMEDNDERKSFLDYLCIDLNYVEDQRNNLVLKHRDLVHESNTCKEQLLVFFFFLGKRDSPR
ncbi:hypothetical protein Tco_0312350 [Tanacetum coccineum]